jgi:GDP-L-fucose synthase
MRVYIAGINGMVGSALAKEARNREYVVLGKSSKELDFRNRTEVFNEFSSLGIDTLIIAAAKVGGIQANSKFPVNFLSDNLQIQTNLIDAAHKAKIKSVLFLGSSCIYPRMATQPIREDQLLTGELEKTNEAYAIAKIAGLKLIEAYRNQYEYRWISAMPTNLYGEKDNFDSESAHVLPALINRIHNAKMNNESEVTIWGDGTPLREFLFTSDLARACFVALDLYNDDMPINIGSGQEISIDTLATLISKIIGFNGSIVFDKSRPNGTPRKLLDSSKILSLGWLPMIDLDVGIRNTYEWFLSNKAKGKLL